jgi:glycosyltransferase involved in cell wall biosynthesis
MGWEDGTRERAKALLAARVRRGCAARVIAVSDSARDAYLATGWDASARVVTVRNGTAARAQPGAGAALRAELGLDPGDLVAGIVTVLRPGKGHDVALAAVSALRERFPRLRLLVAGDGPAAPEVRRLAASLAGAAILTGHRADVMAVLDALDVLVHPSRADALPTVLLEAMAAGVPVVATAVGGIPEIVEHGRTGILLDPAVGGSELAAALAPLLADAGLRHRLAGESRRRLDAQFTAERWLARIRALYDEVLRARAVRAPAGRTAASHRARAAGRPSPPT